MRSVFLLMIVGVLGACSRDVPDLMRLRPSGNGPDEFAIVPTEPLTLDGLPQDVADLPPPTPGGSNITDPDPQGAAYAALGGSSAVANRGADGGIVNYASRHGVDPNIRTALAAEDVEYRKQRKGRFLERVFGVNTYYGAYGEQSLDQHGELDRARRAGVRNPAAPPPGAEVRERPSVIDGPSFYNP